MIEAALAKVAVSAKLAADTVARAAAVPRPAGGDPFSLRRIARERDKATAQYVGDRDIRALQATMARLDAEEKTAKSRPQVPVTARDVRRYLTDLPRLWRETEPAGRRAIAEAAFDRIDAMGLDLVIHPSPEAERYGWSEAFGSEPLVYSISRSGRGERI